MTYGMTKISPAIKADNISQCENEISDLKEAIEVLGNAIKCGFLYDSHSLILQGWIKEYKERLGNLETHLYEMRTHG